MSQGEEKKVGWINDLLSALPLDVPVQKRTGDYRCIWVCACFFFFFLQIRKNTHLLKSIDRNRLRASVDSRQPRRKWEPRAWTGPDLCRRLFCVWGKKKETTVYQNQFIRDQLDFFWRRKGWLEMWILEEVCAHRLVWNKGGDVIFSPYIGGQWIMKIYPHPILPGLHTHCTLWMLKVARSGQTIIVQANYLLS